MPPAALFVKAPDWKQFKLETIQISIGELKNVVNPHNGILLSNKIS